MRCVLIRDPKSDDGHLGRDHAHARANAIQAARAMEEYIRESARSWQIEHGDLTYEQVMAEHERRIGDWVSTEVDLEADLVAALAGAFTGCDVVNEGRDYLRGVGFTEYGPRRAVRPAPERAPVPEPEEPRGFHLAIVGRGGGQVAGYGRTWEKALSEARRHIQHDLGQDPEPILSARLDHAHIESEDPAEQYAFAVNAGADPAVLSNIRSSLQYHPDGQVGRARDMLATAAWMFVNVLDLENLDTREIHAHLDEAIRARLSGEDRYRGDPIRTAIAATPEAMRAAS